MFGRKKVKKGIKQVDGVITGLIIGGAVASIFGLSRTKKGKEITTQIKGTSKDLFTKVKKDSSQKLDELETKSNKVTGFFHKLVGKTIVKISDIFNKK